MKSDESTKAESQIPLGATSEQLTKLLSATTLNGGQAGAALGVLADLLDQMYAASGNTEGFPSPSEVLVRLHDRNPAEVREELRAYIAELLKRNYVASIVGYRSAVEQWVRSERSRLDPRSLLGTARGLLESSRKAKAFDHYVEISRNFEPSIVADEIDQIFEKQRSV